MYVKLLNFLIISFTGINEGAREDERKATDDSKLVSALDFSEKELLFSMVVQ